MFFSLERGVEVYMPYRQHLARIEAEASFILFLMKWCGLAVDELCQKEVMREG